MSLLLITMATLLAAPAPASDEVALTEEAQVRDLCAALRDPGGRFEGDPAEVVEARREAAARRDEALQRWYRLEVPSKGFAFGRFRPQDKQLELDGDRPLRALDGVLALDLEGVDDVAFNATAEQVKLWSAAKKDGSLKLVVVFRASGDRCAGSAAAHAFRLAGKARSWELSGEKGRLALADAEGEPVSTGPHKLQIEKVALDTDDNAPADEGRSRLGGAKRALDQCIAGAQRGGKMVVTFAVENGHARNAQVIMDSLRDEKVSECVARAIAGAEIGGSGHATASLNVE